MSLQKCFFLTDSYNPNEPEDEWTLVYEKTTAGSDTLNLGWGKYRFEVSAGGGGSGAALGGYYNNYYNTSAGASGGTGAYGSFIVEVGVGTTDEFSLVVGTGGSGGTRISGIAPTTSGGATIISSTILGVIATLNGGGAAYAIATNSGDSAVVGGGGTFTTTLTSHNLSKGRNGVSASTSSGSRSAGTTNNPTPYNTAGFSGAWSYNPSNGAMSGKNGGAGFIRIYKSQVYPKVA